MATTPFNGLTTKEGLVYVSRLSSQEKAALFQTADIFKSPQVIANFQACVTDVVLDRFIRADGCLKLASRLSQAGAEEEDLRAAVGRAYYSIHHFIRCIVLHEKQYDPDGHEESIKALRELMKDNAFAGKSGLPKDTSEKIDEAKENPT